MSYEEHKARLKSELETVVGELETIAKLDAKTNDWVAVPEENTMNNADENVGADVAEEWNERRAILGQLEVRYRNIKRALDKIDAGTYGVCEISGEAIEPERLAANPAARTNIANIDREKELTL